MKMTMNMRDTNAIENGMKKYQVDSKGFLEILNVRLQTNKNKPISKDDLLLLHLIECTETYIKWGM